MGYIGYRDIQNESPSCLFYKHSVVKIFSEVTVNGNVFEGSKIESAFFRDAFSDPCLRVRLFFESALQIMLVNDELRYGLYIVETFEALTIAHSGSAPSSGNRVIRAATRVPSSSCPSFL